MSDNRDNHLPADETSVAGNDAARRTRRSLFRAGLAAVPMVLTLRSRPARADIQFASNPDEPFYITGHSPDDQPPPPTPGAQAAPDWLHSGEQSGSARWSTSGWSQDSSFDDLGDTQL